MTKTSKKISCNDPAAPTQMFLTDPIVAALKCRQEDGADRVVWDTEVPGFHIRVSPTQTKTWKFQFDIPGAPEGEKAKRTKRTLGTYSERGADTVIMTLAAARALAEIDRKKVAAGIDPRTKDAAPEALLTVSDLIAKRLAAEVTGKLETADKIAGEYKKYIGDVIGTLPVIKFDLATHYDQCVQPLIDAGSFAMAYVVHAHLHCLFGFAVNRVPGVTHNLAAGRPNPYDYQPADRALDDEELVTLWHLLPIVFKDRPVLWRLLRLQIAIGQRIGEICKMEDNQIDYDKRAWIIPKTKNGKAHVVPLSDLAWELVMDAKAHAQGGFFFPMWDRKLEQHKAQETKNVTSAVGEIHREHAKAVAAGTSTAVYCAFGIDQWSTHDFRRTMITAMDEDLGISEFVQSILVNHTIGAQADSQGRVGAKVTKIYRGKRGSEEKKRDLNIWKHFDEKRAAMNIWGAHLTGLFGGNVVQLREAA